MAQWRRDGVCDGSGRMSPGGDPKPSSVMMECSARLDGDGPCSVSGLLRRESKRESRASSRARRVLCMGTAGVDRCRLTMHVNYGWERGVCPASACRRMAPHGRYSPVDVCWQQRLEAGGCLTRLWLHVKCRHMPPCTAYAMVPRRGR